MKVKLLTVMARYSKVSEIFVTKLHLLKFSKQALQILVCDLYIKYQCFEFNDQHAGLVLVTQGVSQGPILRLNIRGDSLL